jgi:sec-independent protein translocase protein TatA
MCTKEAVMGEFSIYHWLLVVFVVIFFFGGRKIPEMMRGIGAGIGAFRDGINGSVKGDSNEIQPGPQRH